MTLLDQIKHPAVDSKVDITTVLRMARILAAKLNNEVFEAWIKHELNGYPKEKTALRAYRIVAVNSRAHLILGGGFQQLTGAPVIPSLIPEDLREWATTAYLYSPVSNYASLASDTSTGSIQSQWPQELAVKYGGCGYNEAQCIRAWQEIGKNSLDAMVDTVRNKILDFVLEIEAANPSAGEAPQGTQPIPRETVQKIVNNFFGPVGNVSQHGQQVTQTANIGIHSSDLARLVTEFNQHLDDLALSTPEKEMTKSQLATLEAQVAADKPDPVIVRQAGQTLRNITEGAIGSLVATAAQPSVWTWIRHMLSQIC